MRNSDEYKQGMIQQELEKKDTNQNNINITVYFNIACYLQNAFSSQNSFLIHKHKIIVTEGILQFFSFFFVQSRIEVKNGV